MFEEHENCLFQNENNVVLNKNSVEVKPCIDRESKIPDLTIKLYICYDEHEYPSSCNTTAYLSQKFLGMYCTYLIVITSRCG